MNTQSQHPAGEASKLGSRWRGFLLLVPFVLWSTVGASLIGIAAALSPGFRDRGYVKWVRLWGRVPLWLAGVRVTVQGQVHVDSLQPRIVIFNHVSLLDLFVISSLCPPRALVMYKKEFEKIPGLGRALRNLGMIPVDRQNLESAIASIGEAGRRIRDSNATCMIAPEGTRSRLGGLQQFKMGAFHLALEHRIPLVPMVMCGIDRILPMGSCIVRSGEVQVHFLPPVETTDWEREDLRAHTNEVRQMFLKYVPSEKDVANGK
jgi:1-acyl-sn-glycerol-3-phosphate acyltransferase